MGNAHQERTIILGGAFNPFVKITPFIFLGLVKPRGQARP